MTTQKILDLDCVLIESTYYVDLSTGGSYLLPLVKMNDTAGWIYTQTWEKLTTEQKNYILDMLQNYGREVIKNKKNRIIDGFSGGCETVTIIPAQTSYWVWKMDLIKDLSGVFTPYKKFIEFEY